MNAESGLGASIIAGRRPRSSKASAMSVLCVIASMNAAVIASPFFPIEIFYNDAAVR